MKKLLLIFLVLFAFIASAQDPSPLPSITVKRLVAPNTPVFYYNTVDSALWVFKGETGWLRIATNQQLIKYYVPYIGAIKNVNLGLYTITARGQRLPLFNGACQISTITDHGNGTVTIGNGDYHLASDVTGHDSKIYSLTGGTFTMTDLSQNYIVADYNSGNPLINVITDVTLINETTIVPIYSIFRNGNFLHTQNWDALGLALANKVHQSIVKTQRYRRESGLALSESGTRNLNLTSGRVWTGAVPITLDAIATATDNLYLWHHTGGVWTQTVVTQYNNTQYDNGTDLVTLTANRYAINWVFRGVESQKHLYVVLGTGDYTESQAISATLPAIPIAISSHAVLVAKLIVQKNSATAFSIQSAFDTQFGLSAIQSHGDLTGRDVIDSHPSGAISFTPTGTYTATNVTDALYQIDQKTPDRSITNEIQAPTRVGDLIGLTQTTTTISIADKEPAFSKNTAFNKNFGTTAGTVLEGRTFGTAANNNTGDFIQNQNASAQSANMWISGGIRNNGDLLTNGDLWIRQSAEGGIAYFGSSLSAYLRWTGSEFNFSKTVNFDSTINTTGYLLNGNNLFSSLSTNAIAKWDGTKFVDGTAGGATNISYSTTTSTVTVISDTGTDAILPAATQSNAGVLNTVDKTKIDNLWVTTPQTLSGTTPSWNVLTGINAKITMSGNTTITLSNLVAGMTGNLTVTNAATLYTLTFAGYTNKLSSGVYSTTNQAILSGNSKIDMLSWYYDGTYLIWNGSQNYR